MKAVIMENLGVSQEKLLEAEKPLIEKGIEFTSFDRSTDPEILIKEAKDAEVMIIANMPMPDAVIERLPKLKFIDVGFTGVDHVGLNACRKQNVAVSNAAGYSNESVPEEAVEMVLALYRNLKEEDARTRNHQAKSGLGREIKGKTVGIIGLGNIGTRSAELFHAFGADILAHSRHIHDNAPDYIKQTDLETLLKNSDIVLLHCPLNDSTRGMIGKEQLAMMKKDAVLINLARGPVVKSQDLADALKEGIIGGAGIDVFDKEPPLSSDEPLLSAPHTVLAPHIGFATKEAMIIRLGIIMDNLSSWMDGKQKNIIL